MAIRFIPGKWYFLDTDDAYGLYHCIENRTDAFVFESFVFIKAGANTYKHVQVHENDDWPKNLRALNDILTVYSEEQEHVFKKTIVKLFERYVD